MQGRSYCTPVIAATAFTNGPLGDFVEAMPD
jgi:hypothetical protein